MNKALPLVALTALVALALTGCTAAASGGTGTNPAPLGGTSTQTYNANDLVKILQTAEKTIGTGKITGNAALQANIAKAGDLKPSAALTADGGKIVPASCGTTLDNALFTDSKGFGAGSSRIGAELNYSKGIIAIFSATHGSIAAGLANTLTTSLQDLYSACSTMQVVDGSTTLDLTISKLADHTDAAQTWALDESIKVGGTTTPTTVIEALDGNIFITDTAIGGTNADAVAAVNAIVAAAKS
jgi:hypothetical protein